MFFFFAYSLGSKEFEQIVTDIKTGRSGQPKFEKAFTQLVGDSEIHKMIVTNIHKALDKFNSSAKYQRWDETLDMAYTYIYQMFPKFDGTKRDLLNEIRKTFGNKLSNYIIEEYVGEGAGISKSTKENVYKVKKFISQYRTENKKFPTVKEIEKGTGFSKKVIEGYLAALNLMNSVKVDQLVEQSIEQGNRATDSFFKDKKYQPDVIFKRRDLKRSLHKAIEDFLYTIRNSKIYDNAMAYLTTLIENPNMNQAAIQRKLNLTQRQGQLIWDKFKGFMSKPKYRQLFMEASKPEIITKLATIHAEYQTATNKEALLKTIVKRVMDDNRRSL